MADGNKEDAVEVAVEKKENDTTVPTRTGGSEEGHEDEVENLKERIWKMEKEMGNKRPSRQVSVVCCTIV